jgi:tRNA threonylcarbamoyl adenosine modification protein (Sua5/YciO/YrdC/YwlC family)
MTAVIRRYDCDKPLERTRGLRAAVAAVRRGALVVLPTDTVYGLGTDAFSPGAVAALLAAKGRGRDMPVPVLVPSPKTLPGIAMLRGGAGQRLVDAFWPGALTVVCRVQPSLEWDLGETRGTVAVRMPLHPVALEVLAETGPLAVSSANRSGRPPARNIDEAIEQLGDAVAIYLDGGHAQDSVPSTIVDVTGDVPRVLRAGALPIDVLREVEPTTQDVS